MSLFGNVLDPDVKLITPDDPEFEAIAATITPIKRVRSGLSQEKTYIFSDRVGLRRNRYKGANDL